MTSLASALYSGWVRHRRFSPKDHVFYYRVCMVYLDLEEIAQVFSLTPLWSQKRFAPAKFQRSDFHGEAGVPLSYAVRRTIKEQTGRVHTGPIRLLANVRYFGYNINPICTYYCFDESDRYLEFILAEVTNTPWGERQAYVIECNKSGGKQTAQFNKRLHVSPFNPMAMQYHWVSNLPGKRLLLHLENWQNQAKVMDATLHLRREPITAGALNRVLIRYPFMTVKTVVSIYWQALRLWVKRVPIFDHPTPEKTKPISVRAKETL